MLGYRRNMDEHQRDEETIVVDLVPPQYQLSPPHSPPPDSMPKTPEKGKQSLEMFFAKNKKYNPLKRVWQFFGLLRRSFPLIWWITFLKWFLY